MENTENPPENSLKAILYNQISLNPSIAKLDYGNVLVQREYTRSDKVRLFSIGAGQEGLLYASLVGNGLLTAAVIGESSLPCSRTILRTIREIDSGTKNMGVYVIANAQSDLFNLSLAMERATQDCSLRVKLLLIDDGPNHNRENTSSGYLLLVKLVGAMCDIGYLYSDIWDFYCHFVNNILTMNIEFSRNKRENTISINSDLETAFTQLFPIDQYVAFYPLVILLNIKKKLSHLEEYCFMQELLNVFKKFPVRILRIFLADVVVTHGNIATLTILRARNDLYIEFLDHPCSVPGWQHVKRFVPSVSDVFELPPVLSRTGKQYPDCRGPKLNDYQQQTLKQSLEFACCALISCERQLNTIDSEKSRGTIGTRFRTTCEQILFKLKNNKLDIESPFLFMKKMGVIVETALEGVLGSIYGILFEHVAQYFGSIPETTVVVPEMWVEALGRARKAIEQYCNEEQRQTTMFRPICMCEATAKAEISKNASNWLMAVGCGVSAAETGAQETKSDSGNYPDPGAHAVGIWMRALYEGVKFKTKN